MATLTHAHRQLFKRSADERFQSLEELTRHCQRQRELSREHWQPPEEVLPEVFDAQFGLQLGGQGALAMNDWSFSQLCGLAKVNKETVNRLSPETATSVFRETLPRGQKPLQVLAEGQTVRAVHGVSYTRLWNAELLNVVQEFAVDFTPPQTAEGGGTGLYAGEQDLFVFLIDPAGWAEIDGQAFAPGCFLWNSEVGRRSVGISTFWFQAVCANHIVWDATEVVEFSRKHTTNVHESLAEIRRTLEQLVARRDERRDGFVRVMRQAVQQQLGDDADQVLKALHRHGISRKLAQQALEIAERQGRFTIFSLVDALTRLAGSLPFAGERLQADQKAASLRVDSGDQIREPVYVRLINRNRAIAVRREIDRVHDQRTASQLFDFCIDRAAKPVEIRPLLWLKLLLRLDELVPITECSEPLSSVCRHGGFSPEAYSEQSIQDAPLSPLQQRLDGRCLRRRCTPP